jgi:hypothetical protein
MVAGTIGQRDMSTVTSMCNAGIAEVAGLGVHSWAPEIATS